ncbi:hypothetical protein PG985_001313 [Apiospora marii]|uniref:SnoaL-like domain-containing protein n=1 Tax=Apiospora marii TaxID=335849 RepID=A0ABR1RHV1_9PEZI
MPSLTSFVFFSLFSLATLFSQPVYSLDPGIASSASPSPPCPNISPGPVPLSELVQTLQAPSAASDLAAESAIRNKLALYPFAIDTRTFSAFDRIFSEGARANYSYPLGVLEGRQAIRDKLQDSLTMFKGTQHTYGTQFIQICNPTSAISITYYTASHFLTPGTGPEAMTGPENVVIAYGQYQDTWEQQGGEDGWRITNRNLVYTGPLVAAASLLDNASSHATMQDMRM